MTDYHVVPNCICPTCQKPMDRASVADPKDSGHAPVEGDLTVCLFCGQILTFGPDLTLTPLPPEDFSLLDIDTRNQLIKAIDTIKHLENFEQLRIYFPSGHALEGFAAPKDIVDGCLVLSDPYGAEVTVDPRAIIYSVTADTLRYFPQAHPNPSLELKKWIRKHPKWGQELQKPDKYYTFEEFGELVKNGLVMEGD
jgi:hypothetical protein